jgi:hypothetical protein
VVGFLRVRLTNLGTPPDTSVIRSILAACDLLKLGLRAHRQPEKSVNASGSYLAFDYSFLFSSTSRLL